MYFFIIIIYTHEMEHVIWAEKTTGASIEVSLDQGNFFFF